MAEEPGRTAADYALSLWEGLMRFVDDARPRGAGGLPRLGDAAGDRHPQHITFPRDLTST